MSEIEFCNVEQIDETDWADGPLGVASKAACRCTQNGVCGSGSHVGIRGGKSLVLSNAHVCGTRIGRTIDCQFPHLNNRIVKGRVIMAAYSDRILMDWAVVELETELDLVHAKLSNEYPVQGKTHYTAGYPRCRGPYYVEVSTVGVLSHGGTLWRWTPNSIGGQSGSAVHSFGDDLQRGLLTWSWGGRGAGQTTRSIWHQYVNRQAYASGEFGRLRPEGLVELADNIAPDLERGIFTESNITTLPIWDHLDDDDDPEPPGGGGCPVLAAKVMEEAKDLQKRATDLAELARRYGSGGGGDAGGGDDDEGGDGPLFGMG